eukprot:5936212-Prymnesium_polylepis.2
MTTCGCSAICETRGSGSRRTRRHHTLRPRRAGRWRSARRPHRSRRSRSHSSAPLSPRQHLPSQWRRGTPSDEGCALPGRAGRAAAFARTTASASSLRASLCRRRCSPPSCSNQLAPPTFDLSPTRASPPAG